MIKFADFVGFLLNLFCSSNSNFCGAANGRRWGTWPVGFFNLQFQGGLWQDAGMASDAKSRTNPAAVALGQLGGLKGVVSIHKKFFKLKTPFQW